MAQSFGQHMPPGKSDGPLGHGGNHRMGGHGSAAGSHGSNPHTSGSGGHTMSNSHGGSMPMGC